MCSIIHSEKNTVGTVRTMNEVALVLRVLHRRDDVGVVVSGMRGMRDGSMAVRRR